MFTYGPEPNVRGCDRLLVAAAHDPDFAVDDERVAAALLARMRARRRTVRGSEASRHTTTLFAAWVLVASDHDTLAATHAGFESIAALHDAEEQWYARELRSVRETPTAWFPRASEPVATPALPMDLTALAVERDSTGKAAATCYVRLCVEHALPPEVRARYSDTEHTNVLAGAHPTDAARLQLLYATTRGIDLRPDTDALAALAIAAATLAYYCGADAVAVAVGTAARRAQRPQVRALVWLVADTAGVCVWSAKEGCASRHAAELTSAEIWRLAAWAAHALGIADDIAASLLV
jgi:hypothetical protein